MRRRRFAFLFRAMAMLPAPFTAMCGHHERKAEAVQSTPIEEEQSEVARSARGRAGEIIAKAGRDPQGKGGIEAEGSGRGGAARTPSARAR